MKEKWKIDVAVLCIFFVRDEQFAKTFEQVRKAKPSILLLYQDGPRDGKIDDIDGIKNCRNIAENIDWECEVHRWYQDKNYGCDPSTFMSHKWAFSIVDKCIILEDDFVVAQSFFTVCKNLLDKYENDTRINRICGANTLGILKDCPYDYFFSLTGVGGVWATWKRVADEWDQTYSFLDDKYHMNQLRIAEGKRTFNRYYKLAKYHRATGKSYWETILSFNQILNTRLNIVMTKNMVDNIGIGSNSTHTDIPFNQMPKKVRKLYNVPVFELTTEIKHPPYVVANASFLKLYQHLMGNNLTFPVMIYRKIESAFIRIMNGNFKSVINGIKNRFK